MVPLLSTLSSGESRSTREIRNTVSDLVDLTAQQRTEMLPSGRVTRAADRISWALHFLHRVEAIHRPSRATYRITDRGLALLSDHPGGLTERDLKPLAKPGDEWWRQRSPSNDPVGAAVEEPTVSLPEVGVSALDPYELIDQGVAQIHGELASDLLSRLHSQEPTFFERAVVQLLLAMGYGGVGGRGVATAQSNDGGIDGVIDQDVLGLNKVYVQAKRYAPGNAVQRPEVQGFVGALSGKAESGVFITTSRFSKGAVDWARTVPVRLVLIDGQRLAELMIEYGVGVQARHTVRIVEIDEDFFA